MIAKKILIIEDDEDLCKLFVEALKYEGFSATSTPNPAKGIKLIRNGKYDTLLLDYKIPGTNGIEIVKKIKAEKIKMKIIIVSGRPFLEKTLEEEGLSGMVSGVIAKPIDYDELLKKLRQ